MHVAAMGMSCGGLMSYGVSGDPRIATVGIWNSGMFAPKDQKIIDGIIHSPMIIITGGDSDIAHDNGKKDFEVMPARVPIFYGVYPSVGHGGTYNQDNGGPFGQVAVAWLKWQLQGTPALRGRATFLAQTVGFVPIQTGRSSHGLSNRKNPPRVPDPVYPQQAKRG